MKTASYRHAIRWIAVNLEEDIRTENSADGLIVVLLVADIFEVEESKVSADVMKQIDKITKMREDGVI